MGKIIITTDWHMNEYSIPELDEIINEVYFEHDFLPIGTVIIGDLFDRKRPTPLEVNSMTSILCKLLRHMEVTIITGNHEELSKTVSALDYACHFGVTIHRNKVLFKRGLHKYIILFGHFFTEETDKYARSNIKVKDLEAQADLVLLGHFHGFKKMGNYTYHLGSLRRCNFKEVEFGIPQYAIFDTKTNEIEFRDVKCAIPMYEVDSAEKLADIPSRAKVRVVYNDFGRFKSEANMITGYHKKLHEFKVKLDFKNIVESAEVTKDKDVRTFEDIFDEFLHSEVKDKEVRELIKESL